MAKRINRRKKVCQNENIERVPIRQAVKKYPVLVNSDYMTTVDILRSNPGSVGPTNCFLCNSEDLYTLGTFIMNKDLNEKYEIKQDKTRVIFYGLCEKCFSLDGEHVQKVEDKIFSDEKNILASENAMHVKDFINLSVS